ncbi:hypothetical protein PGT21_021723 [Puccinia graminis f. sp. tritici]|uniref:Photolyase/cryptochrome alpha/beta domain-containing protein n=1 Tax=Puccinia graminis f. sp. tritici TaxID=56615 RepID=A0A5B0LN48_PUCGR|nr:hypothetical protein PGT21_021723 [Puccinia graminis f. sp. tritici]
MGVGPRSLTIALFRNDLRLHDNPILTHSHLATVKEGDAVRRNKVSEYVLPLYVFDERQIELSGLEGYRQHGGPARTESVYELKHQLKKSGSDLLVRFGVVEATTLKIIEELQRNGFSVDHVYMAKEVAFEEVGTEKRLAKLLGELAHKVPLTLFHSRSLGGVVTGGPALSAIAATARKTAAVPGAPETILKAAPEPGYSGSLCEGQGFDEVFARLVKPLLSNPDIPHDPKEANTQDYKPDPRSAFPYQGGESEALRRLDDYFFKGNQPPVRSYKTTRNGLLGHQYSTKFSPFLAFGCISPRKIIHSLWDHEAKFGSNKDTYWVLFEILWRDYFIFISQKFGRRLFLIKGFEGRIDPKGATKKLSYWKPFKDEKMNQQSKGKETPGTGMR